MIWLDIRSHQDDIIPHPPRWGMRACWSIALPGWKVVPVPMPTISLRPNHLEVHLVWNPCIPLHHLACAISCASARIKRRWKVRSMLCSSGADHGRRRVRSDGNAGTDLLRRREEQRCRPWPRESSRRLEWRRRARSCRAMQEGFSQGKCMPTPPRLEQGHPLEP